MAVSKLVKVIGLSALVMAVATVINGCSSPTINLATKDQKVSSTPPSTDVVATPISIMHPLVGRWKVQATASCHEVYELRTDGTKSTKSAEERNEAVFEISPTPSTNGFYRWADKIVVSNLKRDCSGEIAEIGHIAISYVLMHSDRQRFLLCHDARLEACFAEFTRTEEPVK